MCRISQVPDFPEEPNEIKNTVQNVKLGLREQQNKTSGIKQMVCTASHKGIKSFRIIEHNALADW